MSLLVMKLAASVANTGVCLSAKCVLVFFYLIFSSLFSLHCFGGLPLLVLGRVAQASELQRCGFTGRGWGVGAEP